MKTFKEKRKERRQIRELRGRRRNTLLDILAEGAELIFDAIIYLIPSVLRILIRIFD